jgi:phage terminase Nu1 subunit (DNA packaging protein)
MLLIGLNPFKNASNENNVIKLAFFYFHLLLISREMSDALDERANGHKRAQRQYCIYFCFLFMPE